VLAPVPLKDLSLMYLIDSEKLCTHTVSFAEITID
jgi:hypothetical protein